MASRGNEDGNGNLLAYVYKPGKYEGVIDGSGYQKSAVKAPGLVVGMKRRKKACLE